MNFVQCGTDKFILNPVDVWYDITKNQLAYKTRFEELCSDPIVLVIENFDELENYSIDLDLDEVIIVGNPIGHSVEFSGEVRKIRFVNSLDEVDLPEVLVEYKMKDW